MTLPWYVPTGALALLIGGGALALRDHDAHVRLEALYQYSIDSIGRVDDSLKAQDARAVKAVVHDTIVLVKWQTAYKAIHDTVLQNVHDTVAVIQFVHTADSTIRACSQLVTDCQARTKILVAQNAARSQEVALWKRQAPNIIQRHVGLVSGATGVLGLVAGVFIGKHL